MDKIVIVINGETFVHDVEMSDVVEITLLDADEEDDGDNEYAYIQRQPFYGWRLHDADAGPKSWRVLNTPSSIGAPRRTAGAEQLRPGRERLVAQGQQGAHRNQSEVKRSQRRAFIQDARRRGRHNKVHILPKESTMPEPTAPMSVVYLQDDDTYVYNAVVHGVIFTTTDECGAECGQPFSRMDVCVTVTPDAEGEQVYHLGCLLQTGCLLLTTEAAGILQAESAYCGKHA